LGGIGAGHVVLSGDGGLRQWQIFNNINHCAHVPFSFFAVSVQEETRERISKLLQSNRLYDVPFEVAPSVSDHVVPRESRALLEKLPSIDRLEMHAEYPVVAVKYSIDNSPIHLELEAYSPFVPPDPDDSGLPAVIFHFQVRNVVRRPVSVSLLMCQQNAVGWDDSTEISGISHPSFGGNRNAVVRRRNYTAIVMDNGSLSENDSRSGEMATAVLDGSAAARAQWASLDDLWDDFASDGWLDSSTEGEPSPAGQTINAALASRVLLGPGEETRITFLLSWRFPNRVADWVQPTLDVGQEPSKTAPWLGNRYAARFSSVLEVIEYVNGKLDIFDRVADRFRAAMYETTLPAPLIDAVSSQVAVIRSPTCFRGADEAFYAFEGCCGASTEMIGERGGCCPLNCTHVWNYAMTMARLFPQLERSMRETEWLHQQHESGYLPHRVVVPLSLPRPWDRWIGGPPFPAVDGLLGAVLKTYREYRAGGGREWLLDLWEHVRLAMEHVMKRYDSGEGVISGPQPCTYDVEIHGPNSFITSLYLAALRAAEEMAKAAGDRESSERYRNRFRLGRKNADELLWNRHYYIHKHDASESVQSYGAGCHSDQLFGQWWANNAGLGYVLPRNRVRKALQSIFKHNYRKDFSGHQQFPRAYVKDDEAGLLNCTWPLGGKPETPLLYSDEVWTGIEYEVAGALLFEGMIEEALEILAAVRKRHDGRLRSPWNEVECGDHYVRPMSSWALLEAAAGYSYDAAKGSIGFRPRFQPEKFSSFFGAGGGWGRYSQRITGGSFSGRLLVLFGAIEVREVRLAFAHTKAARAKKGSRELDCTTRKIGNEVCFRFRNPIEIRTDETLRISIG